MINKDLGTRMKAYEAATGTKLLPHTPTIIRIDGKAFHTFVKIIGAKRPYDEELHFNMLHVLGYLVENIQNAVLGECHSDEMSILLCDFPNLNTEQWFNGKVQKIVSISASMATATFNSIANYTPLAFFDSRVFQLPLYEVNNYFIWRQQDAVRNSINMLGQSLFSHKELQGVGCKELQEKMFKEKNVNWNDLEIWQKRGSVYSKNTTDYYPPIFSTQPQFIDNFITYEYTND